MIESWTPNSTLDGCARAARGGSNALLYNGMVAPFLNMSVKGFLWYQVRVRGVRGEGKG